MGLLFYRRINSNTAVGLIIHEVYMKFLVTLVGLILVLEGLPYVACPESMQEWLRKLSQVSPRLLRVLGGGAMAIGLFLCYVTQRTTLFG